MRLELVYLVRTVAETVVVRHIVEELLGVQRSAQEQCEIPVGCFDDVGDLVNGFSSIEDVLVS